METRETQVFQDPKVFVDSLVQWDPTEYEVTLASQEKMDLRESAGMVVHQELLVNQEFQVPLDSQGHKVHLDSRESVDLLAQWEMLEIQDAQERRDTRERKEPEEIRVPSVNLEQQEKMDQ